MRLTRHNLAVYSVLMTGPLSAVFKVVTLTLPRVIAVLHQYFPLRFDGLLVVAPPGPAQSFLHAQYLGVSLSLAVSQLWRALKDLRAAAL